MQIQKSEEAVQGTGKESVEQPGSKLQDSKGKETRDLPRDK